MVSLSENRITTGYCEGSHKNLPGHSEILRGQQLPKSDSACKIQSLAWQVAILAERCINVMPVVDNRASYFLKWISENSFSFGAYAFNKGNTDHRIFPESCVSDLENEIKRMKLNIKNETGRAATDFIRQKTEYGLLVEQLQVNVRELESEYVRWYYDNRIVSDFYSHLRKDPESALVRFNRMMQLGDFLNRLSTYCFWLNQYHGLLAQKQLGLPYQFVEWQAKKDVAPLFPA